MAAQGLQLIDLRRHDPADLGAAPGQYAEYEDLLQPQQLLLLVVAVTVGADPGRSS